MKGTSKNSRKKRNTQKLNKAGEPPKSTVEQRASKKQFATAAIAAVNQIVKALKPYELSRTQRLKTYQCMLNDEAVFSALDSRLSLIQKAQAKGSFHYKKDSPESIKVKEFLEYCMDNMKDQTVGLVGRTAADHIYNGFAPFEVVYEKGEDEYSDKWKLKKLVYIHPATLNQTNPYKLSDDGDEILGLRQDFSAFTPDSGMSYFTPRGEGKGTDWQGKYIDWRKIVHCSYSATIAEPFGNSPLDAAYELWRSKQLLEDLSITGASRSLEGVPLLKIPSALLEAASLDPSGAAASQVAQITHSMENMHSGNQSFVILPSDTHNEGGTGAPEFDFKLMGVDGGNSGLDIEEMIDKKRKGIFTVLASRHLISGESGGGSYNLQEGEAGIHAHFAERDNMVVSDLWNKQIFPKLLKLNAWKVSKEDMPVWVHSDVQSISMDEKGKYFNRVMRSLPAVPDVVNSLLKDLDINYRVPEGTSPDDIREMMFAFQSESKVGTGEGSSGTGNSQSGGAQSDTNSENKA